MNSISLPTPDEIIATLNSSSLPTLLVEGKDDLEFYRNFESVFNRRKPLTVVDVFPCGNRDVLLNVFERRHEIIAVKTAFLCDQDKWIICGTPLKFKEIITHDGYSLENQLAIALPFENLLDHQQTPDYLAAIESVINYFSFAYNEISNGRSPKISYTLNQIRDLPPPVICHEWKDVLRCNYKYFIQGHCLFSVYTSLLNDKSRKVKYSKSQLIEMAVKLSDQYTSILVGVVSVKLQIEFKN